MKPLLDIVRPGRVASPIDPETGEALDEVEQHRMSLIDHLKDLRKRIMWSLAALGLGMTVSFWYTDALLQWLIAPFNASLADIGVPGGLAIVNAPWEGVSTWMTVALVSGSMLASPMVAYQVWLFVAPGLYATERRAVIPLAISSTTLFVSGALFCYYVIFPFAFPFFIQVIPNVQANVSVGAYLSGVVQMMLVFGACFQLPIITWFLARLGLIDHRDMIIYARYSVVAIFIVAAIITPPDIVSQTLIAVPLMFLYVVSIGVAYFATTKTREPEPAAESS